MADKRIYTIPLRDAWKASLKKRSKKAMSIIREFAEKHMKTDSVKIGPQLNHHVWQRGIKNPPRKVKVQMVPHKEDKKETVWVEMSTSDMSFLKKADDKKTQKEKAKEEQMKKAIESAAGKKGESVAKEVVGAAKEASKAETSGKDSKVEKKPAAKKAGTAKDSTKAKPAEKAGSGSAPKKAAPKKPKASSKKAEASKE